MLQNIASWYKSYGIVGFVSILTYKKCYADAIFEFCRYTEVLLTVQYTAREPQPTTQQPATIKMSALTPASSGFALSLRDYGSSASNSWRRRSLWAHARRAPSG